MPTINLLPTDLAPKGSTLKVINALKQFTFIGYTLFFLVTLGLVGYLVLSSIELQNSVKHQEELKTQIKSLENTEQKIILIKDRLVKIKKIMARSTADNNINITKDIITGRSNLSFQNIEIDGELIKLTVMSNNSLSINELLSYMSQLKQFKRVTLSSFNFNPTAGYSTNLELSNK